MNLFQIISNEIKEKTSSSFKFKLLNVNEEYANINGKLYSYQFAIPKKCNDIEIKNFIDSLNQSNLIEVIQSKVFIMIHIKESFLKLQLSSELNQESNIKSKQTVLIDYSSPNVAKELHIGHIRSTIIGDALARLYKFKGYNVIIQNHLGDFGKSFGLLVAYIKNENIDIEKISSMPLAEIELLYVKANDYLKSNPSFEQQVAINLKEIQESFNANNYEYENKISVVIYKEIVKKTLNHIHDLYEQLDVLLTPTDIKGESDYYQILNEIICELTQCDIAVKEQTGATYIPSKSNSLVLQKNDFIINNEKYSGNYLYPATDLAAIKYRFKTLKVDKALYVVDSRQSDHFKSIFQVAKDIGWVESENQLEHIQFGTILGKDKKPFKTRDGSVVKLQSLIDEAKNRVKQTSDNLGKQYTDKQISDIAISLIKYADLSKNRIKDYVFDWDNLLSINGNNSLYLQYTAVRIQSILKQDFTIVQNTDGYSLTVLEQKLIAKQCQFDETINSCIEQNKLNLLCDYLYELAQLFNLLYGTEVRFINNSKIQAKYFNMLKQLFLTFKIGFNILGIKLLNQI